MTDGNVATLFLSRERRGSRVRLVTPELARPVREPVVRPAKVAVQLATAHLWQAWLDAAEVGDRAEIALRIGISRPRVTQLMDLLWLAPDIQEEVLGLESIDGSEPIGDGRLRTVLAGRLWSEQRAAWAQLRAKLWSRSSVRPAVREQVT